MREHRDELIGKAVMSLPTPPASEDFFAQVRQAIGEGRQFGRSDDRSPRWSLPRVHAGGWRRPAIASAVLAATLIVGGVFGAIFASPSNGAPPTPVASFQPALGWNTFETNVLCDSTPAQPELCDPTQPDILWAANVPFKPESVNWPNNTLKTLPSNGIVIVVVGPASSIGTPDNNPYSLSLPAKLSDFRFLSDNYEGQVAPNVSEYDLWAHLNETRGWEGIDIYVWMGTNQPTQTMIDEANTELARLSLPS